MEGVPAPQWKIVIFLLLAAHLFAEQRMLEYALPRGGTRGTTVEVNLHGQSLKDPREVLFYSPGIKATAFTPGAKPDQDVKVKFEISPNCAVGEHVLRLRTATALSEPITFWVSLFPTIMETEKKIGENDTIEKAQPLPVNSTVEGQILPGGEMDRDYYWIRANQGERVSVEVESVRLGTLPTGGENDLAVRILDTDGKELGGNDDNALFVQDPMLSIIAPRNGNYFIEIKQQIFYPPRQAWYRAHIGTFSRPTAIFPPGGQAGTQLAARILGDPLGERTEKIALPKEPGEFSYFAGKPGERPPTPNVLRVSPYPNVVKTDAADATSVPSLPVALNGIIAKPGQVDIFRFSAKKGERWQVRAYAQTLGSAVDPKFWIRAVNGPKNLLEADDSKPTDLALFGMRGTWRARDTLDPIAIFAPPADGEYEVGVEDSRVAGGPDHVYRVEIEPARNTIYTHIDMPDGYPIPRLVGLIVPQGNRWTLDVQLAPGIGTEYKGDIELEAVGLPRGVSMIAPLFPKGILRMPVQFVATPDAEQQAALIELRARPSGQQAKLDSGSRQSFALVNRPGEQPLHFVFLDKYALAVTQPAPFHVEMDAPAIPLAQNGDLALKVKLVRHGDFKDAVEIQPDWLPPGVSRAGTVTIPAGKDEATLTIQANNKAAPGAYSIAMNATTTGGDAFSGVGRIRVSSPFVELKVSQPYLAVDLKHASVERGQRGQIFGVIRQNKAFAGKAKVALKNLPKGVKMIDPAPEITSKDERLVFQVEADADALQGLYKEITCEVTMVENGQSIRQQTGSGVLRVDPARTVKAAR